MHLSSLDWSLVFAFFVLSLLIGLWASRSAGQNTREFFLSGRNMPWWLLGISMVATTFSADTPNLVTDIVRNNGVSGNWAWWAFLVTGMLTVFVYAKLWRRSKVLTDLEFYELRYSGEEATFLRGFRAFYLGVIFNILVMATVCLAAIKIGAVLLNLTELQTLLIASTITVVYATFGGLRGIIFTDFFQFILAMVGSIWAASYIMQLPKINGIANLITHENVADKISLLPDFNDPSATVSLLVIPLAVQWWASYYPGGEPGGGGYVAQRMLAAKDERNATIATLLFNVGHYALRPWPWLLIALASLIYFPDRASLIAAFPQVNPDIIKDDVAYPAMLTMLPSGLLGLVVASLIAAFMSTISSHLNWGASYITHDLYKRFVEPEASEKKLVNVGRMSTVILMILAAAAALLLENAKAAFDIIVLMGTGTGLIFILRWFWWRINAYSEIAALVISFVIALYFKVFHEPLGFTKLPNHVELLTSVGLTTFGWLLVTYLTRPTSQTVLQRFYRLVQPSAVGWKPVIASGVASGAIQEEEVKEGQLPLEILCMLIGSFTVYGALFATGYWLYGQWTAAIVSTVVVLGGVISLGVLWKRLRS